MGIIPGAFKIQSMRLARFSWNEPLANTVRLARWVRLGPYVERLESAVVWQFVHPNVVLNNVPASFLSVSALAGSPSGGNPASSGVTAGPSCWPASQSSKALGL